MRRLVVIGVLASLCFGSAYAKNSNCYVPAEIEAEQAILFQTELMVVAEACRDPSYVAFLRRNRDTIVDYQRRMIEHFRRNGARQAEVSFDAYLTRLANESALRNGEAPVEALCRQGAPLLATANALNREDLRNFAAEKAALNRRNYVACR